MLPPVLAPNGPVDELEAAGVFPNTLAPAPLVGVAAEPKTLPPLAGVAEPNTLAPLADAPPPNTLPPAEVGTVPNVLPDDGTAAEAAPNTLPLDTALVEAPKLPPLLVAALPKILPELVEVVVVVAAVEVAPGEDVPKILPLGVALAPNIPLEGGVVVAVLPNTEALPVVEVVAPNKLEDCVLLTLTEPKRLLVEAEVVVVVVEVVVPNSPGVAEVVAGAPNMPPPLVDGDIAVMVLSPIVLLKVVVVAPAPAPKMLPDELLVVV